ncbi:MAG: CvpA family protein [Alphaproteobacteria bacterium]|nr:CvpA family protein [Alphaproteobacteria bacterium]
MSLSSINGFDLAVFGLLLASGIFAFRRGFVRELFSLGTWIAASIVAVTYYPTVKPWMMSHHVKNELAAEVLSVAAVFAVMLIILIPLGNYLAGMIKGQTMTSIDRSLGFVFGLVRGFLVLCLVYLVLTWVWPEADDQPTWLSESRVSPILAGGADMLRDFIPEEEQEAAAEKIREKRESAEQATEDAEHLKDISIPVPSAGKEVKGISSSYGEEARNKLDKILEKRNER